MVAKEGILPAILTFSVSLAFAAPLYFQGGSVFTKWNFYAASIFFILGLWLCWFFRDPEIRIEKNPDVLLSPASGKVLEVEETPAGKVVRIFMSILDYHIQRSPCDGKVEKISYQKGKFLNAASKEAKNKNEKNEIFIDSGSGKIKVTQIAGILARRILCWKNPQDSVSQGEKVGMIFLGSQVACEFSGSFEVLVKKGEKVCCGKTVIARKK